MKNRTFYCGIRDFVVKVKESDRDFVDFARYAEYTFFKNEDGEYEFLKTRYGNKDFMFLSLDDAKSYLSVVGEFEIKMFKVVKNTPNVIEKFREIMRGHYGI